jgi:hypothetical protein
LLFDAALDVVGYLRITYFNGTDQREEWENSINFPSGP